MSELVLIVDDNAQNARLVRDVLQAGGLRTLIASSAAEGFDLACEHAPDLVLMDLYLPDGDGVATARRLLGDERTARIPVVALSAISAGDARSWIEDVGFAGYIEKPIDVNALPRQVRGYCRRC